MHGWSGSLPRARCLVWIGLLFVAARGAAAPPNVLLIMADDLGYSDLGCYGGEIDTPHLDRLAANGLRFTNFNNTGRCWPSRAALLTGFYAQEVRRDNLPGVPLRGNRPSWAQLLPRRLPEEYRAYHAGKWHIDGMPLENGFDRSYYLRDQGRFFSPRVHYEDDKKLPPVELGSDFYGTTEIANRAIAQLEHHHANHAQRPFFHYLAFTAPHFPLHARPEDIAKFQDRYRVGWDAIRAARYKRIQEMDLVRGKLSDVERELGPPYHFPEAMQQLGPLEINRPLPWSSLTPKQRVFQATKMAIHAAMVHCMDREIGRVLEQLRKMKAFDNTLVLFLSDNGASAEIMVRDDGHDPEAAPGSAKSYLCLGPGWSTVCNTPFRRHKTWVHRGGVSTPLIAHWPEGIRDRGALRRTHGHVVDIVPTILELAGLDFHSMKFPGRPKRSLPAPGLSLVPIFAEDATTHNYATRLLWWCHEGNRALLAGHLRLAAAKGEPWQLFDVRVDPAETEDLAGKRESTGLQEMWQHVADQLGARAAPPR